jgi:hypothetical protein
MFPYRKLFSEPAKAPFYAYFYLAYLTKRLRGSRAEIAVGPDDVWRPILMWKVARLLGVRLTKASSARVVLGYRFDIDTVKTRPGWPTTQPCVINRHCDDISKSRVAEVFTEVFGYNAEVDPTTHAGSMVCKSEVNALHDGRVIKGPVEPEPGVVYQRVLDNEVAGGLVEDLRICIVGKQIVFALSKARPVEQRFANLSVRTRVLDMDATFTEREQDLILKFTERFGLDMGEIDLIRDGEDGRLYILDVNDTPHAPPDSLISLAGIRCMRAAAGAFEREFLREPGRSAEKTAFSRGVTRMNADKPG